MTLETSIKIKRLAALRKHSWKTAKQQWEIDKLSRELANARERSTKGSTKR